MTNERLGLSHLSLVRHGESAGNVAANREMDVPLSPGNAAPVAAAAVVAGRVAAAMAAVAACIS